MSSVRHRAVIAKIKNPGASIAQALVLRMMDYLLYVLCGVSATEAGNTATKRSAGGLGTALATMPNYIHTYVVNSGTAGSSHGAKICPAGLQQTPHFSKTLCASLSLSP